MPRITKQTKQTKQKWKIVDILTTISKEVVYLHFHSLFNVSDAEI